MNKFEIFKYGPQVVVKLTKGGLQVIFKLTKLRSALKPRFHRACDAMRPLCDWFRLRLIRDLCNYWNYIFSTTMIADQLPTSRRTIGDSFCMQSVIDRRPVAVGSVTGLQLV